MRGRASNEHRRAHGDSYCIFVGVQVAPTSGGTGMLVAAGGVAHGTPVKSKKSSKFGCAASR